MQGKETSPLKEVALWIIAGHPAGQDAQQK
jgi:hypothetical protein